MRLLLLKRYKKHSGHTCISDDNQKNIVKGYFPLAILTDDKIIDGEQVS